MKHYDIDDLIAYLDADVDVATKDAITEHLRSCADCSSETNRIRERLDFFDNRFSLKRLEEIDSRVRACAALEAAQRANPALAARLAHWAQGLRDLLLPPDAWEPVYVGGVMGPAPATRIELTPARPLANLEISDGPDEPVEVHGGASGMLMISAISKDPPEPPEIRPIEAGRPCATFTLAPGRYIIALELRS
ncbi:MAG: zf-HC2 domain-containing protein [Bryobacteraceae bacterium]